MNTLAVDTSTNNLHLALRANGQLEERLIIAENKHSQILLKEVKSMLENQNIEAKDLELLACTKGPGGFTSLRIGMSFLKGLATGLNIPLVSVLTSKLLYSVVEDFKYPTLTCIDAKKKRFYLALYEDGKTIIEDIDANIVNIKDILNQYDTILLTGPDAALVKKDTEDLTCKVIVDTKTRALGNELIDLAIKQYSEVGRDEIGDGPLYIRVSDAELSLQERMNGKN